MHHLLAVLKKHCCIFYYPLLASVPPESPVIENPLERSTKLLPLRALPWLGIALLGACAPSIRLDQPDVRLPAAFETAAPAPTGPSVSLDRWWEDFHDPQLSDLVSTALTRSTTIRLAYARIAEARAQRRQARASTLPSGNLSGAATEQGSDALWGNGLTQTGNDTYQLNFSPSWEIDLFGRLAEVRDRADLDDAASTMDFHGVQLTLVADVATALFRARYLATQLADARDNLRIAQELSNAGALGQTRGITAAQEVARLRSDAASREAEVSRLTGELQTAKRSLLILIGIPAASTSTLEIAEVLDAPPLLPELTPGLLLTRRPDVRAAELALQSAAATVKIDRLALFPRIDLQPGLGLIAGGGAADGTGLWSLVAGFALPVLDRARLLATLRVSEARGQQAVIGYERAVQTAFGEAENALTSIAADERRSEQLDRATRDAKTGFDAARRGYAAGLTDLTTLLQAERSWRQTRSTLNGARAGLLASTVDAIRALGGGWNPAVTGGPDQLQPTTSGNP